jgi:transposase
MLSELHAVARPHPSDLTTARRLYEQDGLSFREIGAQFGVSHSTIGTLLRATGVQSRAVG